MFDALTGIRPLYKKALNTGRMMRLSNSLGLFPTEASRNADMAVGIGISSAGMEAVIAGCRGIHCDLSLDYTHYYYTFGFEKIIFDDIDKLCKAILRFKNNPRNDLN